MKTIRVIIVDDHFLVRVGLRNTLEMKNDEDFQIEVVGEAANAKEFYALLEQGLEADIVLLDLNLPDETGGQIAKRIISSGSEMKILILSAENSHEMVGQLLDVEINGFIGKGGPPRELFRAIESICSGVNYYGKDMAALLHSIVVSKENVEEDIFTPTEFKVLKLAATGAYTKEIADELDMNVKTVSVHKTRIFKKLGINSNSELVLYAIKKGLIKI